MMHNLHSWSVKHPGPVSGVFRMREPALCQTKEGRPYLRIRLEDMSGSLNAFAWQENIYQNLNFQDLSCVYVKGQIRQRSDAAIVDL